MTIPMPPMHDTLRRHAGLTLLGVVLLISGCSDPYQWKTSNVTGKFPDLEFKLTSEQNNTVTEEDFTDTVNLLFFGYTSCPDVCPMTLSRLSAVMDELKPRERRQLRILFVSVDPGRDSPARLRDYTDAFGPRVIGATADKATLKDFTSRYFMTFSYGETDEDGNYDVRHNGSVLAFDRQGKARLKIAASSVGGTPSDSVDAIVADLRALLSE